MLTKEELYTQDLKDAKTDALSSEKIRGKLLLILNLFFATLILIYLIYNLQESSNSSKKTKVLGVSYVPDNNRYDETEILEQQLKSVEVDTLNSAINGAIRYNHSNKIELTGSSEDNYRQDFENIVVVDDKEEYQGATVVDDRDEYRDVVVVKNPI